MGYYINSIKICSVKSFWSRLDGLLWGKVKIKIPKKIFLSHVYLKTSIWVSYFGRNFFPGLFYTCIIIHMHPRLKWELTVKNSDSTKYLCFWGLNWGGYRNTSTNNSLKITILKFFTKCIPSGLNFCIFPNFVKYKKENWIYLI